MTEILRAAATDGTATFLWIFISSALRIAPSLIGLRRSAFLLRVVLNAILTSAFHLLAGSYNPASSIAKRIAGVSPPIRPLSLALRFLFQLAASVLAVRAVLSLPYPRLRALSGPISTVSTLAGTATEGTITFFKSSAHLWAAKRWPHCILLRNLILAAVNAALAVPGARLTGSSTNPIIAFGWVHIERIKHPSWERSYCIYWLGPFVGAFAAGLLYRGIAAHRRTVEREGRTRVERPRPSRPPPTRGIAVVPLRRKALSLVSAEFHAVLPGPLPLRASLARGYVF